MSRKTHALCMFIILASVVFIAGCVSSNEPPVKPLTNPGYETYANADYGISMDYPSTWTVNDASEVVAVAFSSPLESSEDAFHESVNLAMNDLSGENMDMEAYTTLLLEQVSAAYPDAVITEAKDAVLDSSPARMIVFSFQGQYGKLKSMQTWTIKDKTAYVVTYTAEESNFDNYRATAEKMTASLDISAMPGQKPANPVQPAPENPQNNVAANSEFAGRWRAYSEAIFYDSGGSKYLDRAVTRVLEIKADGTWAFGTSSGTWKVDPVSFADWQKWDTSDYGPTRKMTLNGWNGGVADGPIEETESRVDFIWVIYKEEPPTVSSPGQVQIKFGHAINS